MFLQNAIAGLKVMAEAKAPIFINPVIKAAGEKIVAGAVSRRIVFEITMAEGPVPSVVG